MVVSKNELIWQSGPESPQDSRFSTARPIFVLLVTVHFFRGVGSGLFTVSDFQFAQTGEKFYQNAVTRTFGFSPLSLASLDFFPDLNLKIKLLL